ncbi:hypothetical protein KW484_13400 [Vibrio fluvialis]|nr:hypothetical protein [Vibrio fluvialis]
MNFKTISDVSNLIDSKLHVFLEKKYDLIVGIPRSGLLVGSIVSLKLNLPIVSFQEFMNNSAVKVGITRNSKVSLSLAHDAKKVLLIDDSYNSGRSMEKILKELSEINLDNIEIDTAVIYTSQKKMDDVDFFLEYVPQPRAFEWNLFHSKVVNKILFDIDGVVCVDPTDKENDDGNEYKKFLLTAKPKHIPSHQVKGFVTSRLERYRPETTKWLSDNGIEFQSLIMSNHESAEQRKKANDHGYHKGIIYKDSDAILFIESDSKQAREISKISGKNVYCIDENKLFTPGYVDVLSNVNGIKYFIVNKMKSSSFIMSIYKKLK